MYLTRSGAADYPLLVAVSSGTNPCSGRRFVCNDLRQGYWRGLKLGLRSVRYARHRESGTIYQIQTCEARSLRCRVETVFIGGLIQWVLQRGGLLQCLARAALPLLRRRPKRCRSRLRNNHGQLIAHSGHSPPINVRIALLEIPGYLLRRFSNDLNAADERTLCRLIRVEM